MNRQVSSVALSVMLAFGMTAFAKAPLASDTGAGIKIGPVACGIDTSPGQAPKYPCGETGQIVCGIDTSPTGAPKYPCK